MTNQIITTEQIAQAGHASDKLAEILTAGYELHSPLVRAVVWGHRGDSPAEMHLQDGTVIRLDQMKELLKLDDLAVALTLGTAGRTKVPAKTRDELRGLMFVFVEFAQVQAADDQRAEADEWIQRFLRASGGAVLDADMTDPAERYTVLGEMQDRRYSAHGGTALIVRDTATGDLYLRASDLLVFVRESVGERGMTAQRLGPRMEQAGYQRRTLEQWKPGADRQSYRKRKVIAYRIPATGSDET